jgi:predicted HicB family RNase H-like nuclease
MRSWRRRGQSEPAWTLEAAADPDGLVRQPDPKSRAGYRRLIGHSPSAGAVLTVISDPHDGSGVTRWMARGVPICVVTSIARSPLMTETTDGVREARRARHHAIRAEVAQEEAETAQAEVTGEGGSARRALHLRIDRELDAQLRRQAAEAHVPTSALVRRLLRQAVQQPGEQLTTADVESIARRVAREEPHRE